MIRWDERSFEDLVRKAGLRRTPGQGKTPIHLSLYGTRGGEPLMTILAARIEPARWQTLGYSEIDRVSAMKALCCLGCRVTNGNDASSLEAAVEIGCPVPLTPELVHILIDAGCASSVKILHYAAEIPGLTPELFQALRPEEFTAKDAHGVMVTAAYHQSPLSWDSAKALIDAGADPARNPVNFKSIDMLQRLANSELPVDPKTVELFIRAGCKTDLNPARFIDTKSLERLKIILQQHAAWKLEQEGSVYPCESPVDWRR